MTNQQSDLDRLLELHHKEDRHMNNEMWNEFHTLKAKIEGKINLANERKHRSGITITKEQQALRIKDLESRVAKLLEELSVMNTVNEGSQILISKAQDKIAKLKDELNDRSDQIINMLKHEDIQTEQLEQLKSTLDEIENSFENDGICCVRCYGLSRKSLKEILAKHEGKK